MGNLTFVDSSPEHMWIQVGNSGFELLKNCLVGGLEHELFFPSYWECHHPN